MKRLVVLTGAGMSSESGIKTFRDSGGLWEEYDVSEVATPEAWARNRELVLRFYNERRRQLAGCTPNTGHTGSGCLLKNTLMYRSLPRISMISTKGREAQKYCIFMVS